MVLLELELELASTCRGSLNSVERGRAVSRGDVLVPDVSGCAPESATPSYEQVQRIQYY